MKWSGSRATPLAFLDVGFESVGIGLKAVIALFLLLDFCVIKLIRRPHPVWFQCCFHLCKQLGITTDDSRFHKIGNDSDIRSGLALAVGYGAYTMTKIQVQIPQGSYPLTERIVAGGIACRC